MPSITLESNQSLGQPAPAKTRAKRKPTVIKNKHNSEQKGIDRNGWTTVQGEAFSEARKKFNMEYLQQLPGDMGYRGVWTVEGQLCYVPYSQMSCAVGLAVVETPDCIDKVSQLANKFGKVFLFTTVQDRLKKYARSKPDQFKELLIQESWMWGNKDVVLFAAVSNSGE